MVDFVSPVVVLRHRLDYVDVRHLQTRQKGMVSDERQQGKENDTKTIMDRLPAREESGSG